jgi:hypothetical protein
MNKFQKKKSIQLLNKNKVIDISRSIENQLKSKKYFVAIEY